MPDETVILARKYQLTDLVGAEHANYCDYLRRRPARYDDCDCGAFGSHEASLADIAEELAEAVLAKHALIESSEALREHD